MKNNLIFIIFLIFAGSAGFVLQKQLSQSQASSRISSQTGKNPVIGIPRPEFAAMDLTGQLRNIKEWDGDVIFLNFWATWCPPCKKEIPDFIDLQKTYGEQKFQIIGIAIDEADAVAAFAQKTGINYPIIAVQQAGSGLAKRYGNQVGALPYTVVINRKGEISNTIMGELSKIDAKKLLKEQGIEL